MAFFKASAFQYLKVPILLLSRQGALITTLCVCVFGGRGGGGGGGGGEWGF